MSVVIRTQADLDRLNIQTAWQFSHRMSAEAFEELCRVTIRQLHHDAGCPDRCLDRLDLHAA